MWQVGYATGAASHALPPTVRDFGVFSAGAMHAQAKAPREFGLFVVAQVLAGMNMLCPSELLIAQDC